MKIVGFIQWDGQLLLNERFRNRRARHRQIGVRLEMHDGRRAGVPTGVNASGMSGTTLMSSIVEAFMFADPKSTLLLHALRTLAHAPTTTTRHHLRMRRKPARTFSPTR